MCKTYNMIGSLSTLKSHLKDNNIYDFKSLKEVIDFQSSYTTKRQQLIFHHESLIEQEKIIIKTELQQLDAEIETQKQQSEKVLTDEIDKLKQQLNISTNNTSTNIFKILTKNFKQWNYKRQLRHKESNFDLELKRSIKKLVDIRQDKNNRYQFITLQFKTAVEQSSQTSLSEIERKKSVVDKLSSFIYGALGEQKVVKTLETLSDEYFLINDFAVYFSPAIYNRQENDYIKSIQIDHLLVAPSGIFLIETKNWSEKSLENLSLRSPVQQIKRTSFVLFKLLNNEMSNSHLRLGKHHWGDKKISIKNLIVLTNTKPKEEFQYVKILTLNELLGYINYFKPIFSSIETQRIAEFLLEINDQKTIDTK
ncbi:NERD domain-containing protein [Candidatus Dojkabacteria bacterium]|nr:NERD domain-containing protein [Candidatus Dojkabacteria bacterium]